MQQGINGTRAAQFLDRPEVDATLTVQIDAAVEHERGGAVSAAQLVRLADLAFVAGSVC